MQKMNLTEEEESQKECNTVNVITNKTMDVRRKCDRCGSSFIKLYEYYKHRAGCQGKLGGSPKTCRHCRQEFQFLSLYRKHLLTCWKWHQNMKSREKCQLKNCSVTRALFKKNEKVKESSTLSESSSPSHNSKVVNKISKYSTVCPLCQQSFRSSQNYKLHLKKKGLCRPKPYICNACGREFLSAHHLLSHERRKIPCTFNNEKCNKIKKKDMLVDKSMKQYKYQNYDRSESSTADGSTSSYDEERNPKNLAPLDHFGDSHSTTSENEVSEIILETEINNSPLRVKNSDSKSCKEYFNYKSYQKLSQLPNFNLNVEGNIDISDCICKGCEVVFLYPHEAAKHFEQNPKCYAATQKWKTTELLEHLNENEMKQTARKSFPTVRGVSNYKKENVFAIRKTESPYMYDSSSKGSVAAKKSDCIILGSARKSSQDTSSAPSWKIEKNYNEDKSNLICDVCQAEFLSLQSLNDHMRKHSSQKKSTYVTKCPVCFQLFYNTFLLFSHQKKFHHWGKATKTKTADCKCPFCDKIFVYVRSRNAHLRSHAERSSEDIENFLQKTTCEVCSQAFISEPLKIQHVKVAHPDWTRALPKLFSNIELRNQAHYKRTHEQKNSSDKHLHVSAHKYKYVGFSKNMKVMVSITPAIRAKLKKHPTVCPICFKHYSTSFVRNRHFRMHTLETAFECKWCPTKFPRSDRLTYHMQQNHNDLLEFECLGCGLRFLTKVRALQHIGKVHTNQPSKSLVKERKISPLQEAQHIKFNETVSTNETNSVKVIEVKSFPNEISTPDQDAFFCEVCKIGFLKLCGLQRHRQSKNHRDCLANSQKIISPVEPQSQPDHSNLLKCSVCSQVFSSVMNFVPHRLSHFNLQSIDLSQISDVNPYQCEICMQLLDHHQRVQLHLLWHLRSTKSKNLFSSHKDGFGLENAYVSRKEIYDIKSGLQVAKKSITNKPDKHFQQELIIGGIKKHLFTCDACNIGFTTKHHYSAHVRRYCQVRKASLKVDTYIELEKSPSGLRSKWRLLPPERKLLCHHCSLEFNTVDDLGWHEKSCRKVNSSEKGSYNDIKKEICYCKICKCLFSSEESFQEHKPISCCADFQTGSSSSAFSGENENVDLLKSAMEYESSVAGCIRCGLTFSSLCSLAKHMDLHESKSNMSNDANAEEIEVTSLKDEERVASSIKDESECKVPELLREHLVTNSETSFNENMHLDPPTLHEADLQFQHSKISPKLSCNEDLVGNNLEQSDASCAKPLDSAKDNCLLNNEYSELDKNIFENLDEEDSENILEKRTSLPEEALDSLRDNFSHLLFLLVSDPELMQQLGWGQRLIDVVLEDVLQHMGQVPVVYSHAISDLDRLRKNIQLLLEVCIKDQVMTFVASGKATIDSVVAEVLQMCRDNLEEQSPSVDAIS